MQDKTILLPLGKSWERVELDRNDSDTSLFLALMYLGEHAVKILTAGFVASIVDDPQRTRYRQLYRLVRADGIGEWVQVLEEILTGPPSQYISASLRDDQRQLTERVSAGEWQHDLTLAMSGALVAVGQATETIQGKVNALKGLSIFATLRNKTRGHGATLSGKYIAACPHLERSLQLLSKNHSLFGRQWAYLHENLSGKYRVTPLSSESEDFSAIRRTPPKRPLPDGIYFYSDEPIFVELVLSDVDASDFFVPNGNFDAKRYEAISYLTDDRRIESAAPYLLPAQELPESETDGLKELDVVGNVFSNLPVKQGAYISRPTLENELLDLACDDRYPVITLVGRGGIGKTSLALSVLHEIAKGDRFETIYWFSSRDIDFVSDGPKQVKPRVLTVTDMARDFSRLMAPVEAREKGFKAEEYLASSLTKSPSGKPILFVFDNFETVRNPAELFAWISAYIRLPNKVMITTRIREFKADYPVEVRGMNEDECEALIYQTAIRLNVRDLVDAEFRRELISDSDGHPYVIKIHLGEVARTRSKIRLDRVVASKDEILDALFERTYGALTFAARHIFLTLCGWRSLVPEIAVEAVLTVRASEPISVADAIEELARFSLIEVLEGAETHDRWLFTPLAASVFGRKKLAVSLIKTSVEADLQLLQLMGAVQRSDLRHGVRVRLERFVKTLVEKMARQESSIPELRPIVEFIAQKMPFAWSELARLHEELGEKHRATAAIERYLESDTLNDDERATGWDRLATLYRGQDNSLGELNALVERAQLKNISLVDMGSITARTHWILKNFHLDTPERRIVIKKLIDVYEKFLSSAPVDATDYSRLAWLYLRMGNEEKALSLAKKGVSIDEANEYCLALIKKLQK